MMIRLNCLNLSLNNCIINSQRLDRPSIPVLSVWFTSRPLSNQYKLQVSNYIFQVLRSNINEEIESSLLINKQILSHNTRTNNQMSILRVNISKTKHCVLHNGMITWNYLPDIFKVKASFSMFKSKVRNFYLEKY